MSFEVFIALAGFAFVASITPGPNNIMVLSSVVNYGLNRTIPHMLGILAGFTFLLASTGLGLGQVLDRAPVLFSGIKFAGAVYLLYLAWRIAISKPLANGISRAKPMSFIEAVLFQWVNPKAWVMALTALTIYTNQAEFLISTLIVVITFPVVTVPSLFLWSGFGVGLREWLSNPARSKVFNYSMAILLVLSLWPMLR